ncbi:MAG: thioredoxin, partial [Gammaproteobacteria bacterium]|nr:thioredoxin [Gammaproteobacteria bacterium]
MLRILFALLLFSMMSWVAADAPDADFPLFDDSPLDEPLGFPDWFKLSFLDFNEDLLEAKEAGKDGLIIYYGQ